jgi:hypothetical protein
MLTKRNAPVSFDFMPQAILWRPIRYFSKTATQCEDEFDKFEYTSYSIGNSLNFELRHYAGHRDFTSTIYIGFRDNAVREISESVKTIMDSFGVPETALAWRRGQDFRYGDLPRNRNDRLLEKEARPLALKIASLQPNRRATFKFIKNKIPEFYKPSPADLDTKKRAPEPLWRQVVGNVNRWTTNGILARRLAERVGSDIRVTDEGMAYLNSRGWSDD